MGLNKYLARQLGSPAGAGGRLIFSVMNRYNRPLYEETVRLLAPSNADSILDVGCGNGFVLNMLARQYDCIFAGIDTSSSIIETASRRCHKHVESGKITLACQNAGTMSFADASFDKAYTINTVYFWENLNDTMLEIQRVLKPNGLFVNTLYSNETLSRFSHTRFGYRRFTVEELTHAGSNAGFVVNVMPVLSGTAYCILYHKMS